MHKLAIFMLSLSLAGAAFAGSARVSAIYDLHPLGRSSYPGDVNDKGQMLGLRAATSSRPEELVVLDPRGVTLLAPPAGSSLASASEINELGVVAGTVGIGGGRSAVMWDTNTGTSRYLAEPTAYPSPRKVSVTGINKRGQAVGTINLSGFASAALLWEGDTVRTLATPSAAYVFGFAEDINEAGVVVGAVMTLWYGSDRPVLWNENGALVDLGVPSGFQSARARAINNTGLIVGASTTQNGFQRATLWMDGAPRLLPILPATDPGWSWAYDVNDNALAVGAAFVSDTNRVSRAVLWDYDGIHDLNQRLDARSREQGWVLVSAEAINAQGWIMAQGVRNSEPDVLYSLLLVPRP